MPAEVLKELNKGFPPEQAALLYEALEQMKDEIEDDFFEKRQVATQKDIERVRTEIESVRTEIVRSQNKVIIFVTGILGSLLTIFKALDFFIK